MLWVNQSEGDRLLVLTPVGPLYIKVLGIPAHHKVLLEIVKDGLAERRVVGLHKTLNLPVAGQAVRIEARDMRKHGKAEIGVDAPSHWFIVRSNGAYAWPSSTRGR
jgi:hypothetical protein